jgi:hypothetical protein
MSSSPETFPLPGSDPVLLTVSKETLAVISLRDGKAWKMEDARPLLRDGEMPRVLAWLSAVVDDVLGAPTKPNSEDDTPFCGSQFRALAAEMVDGCGLLVNIVVDGTEGGGKYESSDMGMRLVDGVEETDFEGIRDDVEVDSESVRVNVDGDESMYEAALEDGE